MIKRLIQGSVQSIQSVAGKLMRVTFSGMFDELIEERIVVQQYGLQSSPRTGARVLAIREGEQIIVLGTDDTKYRMQLSDGDVVVYSDLNNYIKLKGAGGMEVKATQSVSFNDGALEILP